MSIAYEHFENCPELKTLFKISEMEATNVDVETLRNNLGLTQEEFASKFNFRLDSIVAWENNIFVPDKWSLAKLVVIEAMTKSKSGLKTKEQFNFDSWCDDRR